MIPDLTLDRLMVALAAVNLAVLLLTIATCRIAVRIRLRRRSGVGARGRTDFTELLREIDRSAAQSPEVPPRPDPLEADPEAGPTRPADPVPRGEARLATDLADWRKRHGGVPAAGAEPTNGSQVERLRALLDRLDSTRGGSDERSARAEVS